MSVHKFVLPMFVLSLMTVACEEKKAGDAEATSGTPVAAEAAKAAPASEPAAAAATPAADANAVAAAKEAALPGPQEVCVALTEAAKAKDDSKILAASTPATATAFAAEGAKDHIVAILAGATCGTFTIDGDSATVALGTAEPIKQATFSKAADGWKFDGAAFLAKYPVAVAKEKAKKAAAKVQHKAAGHAKKHH
jgi:hypothetical protein